jgi:hypothetical protein
MAAAQPAGVPTGPVPPPLVDPATVRTLKARCADPLYDPYHGDYRDAYRHFRPGEGADDNAATLTRELLASTSTAPMYFAACVHYAPNAHRVITVHHPFTVHALFGQRSEHDGKSYALIGDVIEGQIPTIIEFPLDLFSNPAPDNGQLTVMRMEALIEYFAEHPDEDWMPDEIPVDDQRAIRIRKGVFVPTPLVRHFIDVPRSPREAFLHVVGELMATEQMDMAQPLVDWLIACCKKRELPPGLQLDIQLPPAPATSTSYLRTPNTEELVKIVLDKMWHELPTLRPGAIAVAAGVGPTAADATGHAMIHALEALTASNLRPPPAAKVSTPADVYGTNLETLLRIEHVDRQEQLPKVFADLARSPKNQQLMTLTNHFGIAALRLGVMAPVVTKKVTEFFVNLRFGFPDPNNLFDSVSPFLFPPLNWRQRQEADALYRTYADLLYSGGLISMRESAQVDEHDRRAIPLRTLTDLRETLTGFHVFVHVLFDVVDDDDVVVVGQTSQRQHGFVTAWDQLWRQLQQNDRRWEEELKWPGRAFDVVRWIHIRAATWAQEQHRSSMVLEVPRFYNLWQSILYLDTSWIPSKAPDHTPFGAHSVAAVRSPPTAPETLPRPAPEAGAGSKRQRNPPGTTAHKNPAVHADFHFIRDKKEISIKEAVAKGWRVQDPPPFTLHTPSIPYCLAYHTKGSCNSNCSKVADHIEHTPEDHEALKAWVGRNF